MAHEIIEELYRLNGAIRLFPEDGDIEAKRELVRQANAIIDYVNEQSYDRQKELFTGRKNATIIWEEVKC